MCSCGIQEATQAEIRLVIAGQTCTPWAGLGKHEGCLHQNQLTFLIWVFAMRHYKPDVIIHEITPGHPEEALEFHLGHLDTIKVYYLAPCDAG